MNTILLAAVLCLPALDRSARDAGGPEPSPQQVAAPSTPRASTSVALSDERHARLHFDTDASGATWVRGRGYKARFDSTGATVFPFLGSDAPALYPVRTALASAAVGDVTIELAAPKSAVRANATITLDRGAVDERYDVGVEGVEQSFVIESLPAKGDLHLRVSLQTELAAATSDDGFVFSNDRGGVRYGRAMVRTAAGDTIGVPTALVDGAIAIDVPQALVEAVGLPLVVDPLISVFTIDQYQDQFAADVAYDATNDVYLVVEEEKFASVDDDVYTIRVSPTGANVGAGYADLTTADWQTPRVANLNAYDQFLVVASIQDPAVAFGQRYIGGRETPANAVAWGTTFPISETIVLGTMVNPDVGGDPYPSAPAYYCVTWQWDTAIVPQTNEIAYRMVGSAGATAGSTSGLSTGAHDRAPAISNGNAGQTWTLAWTRDVNAPSDVDVYAARINWDGFLTSAAFLVDNGSTYIEHPCVSSPFDTGECVIAYHAESPTWSGILTILGRVLTGTSVGAVQDIGPTDYQWDLYAPSADCDGRYLVVGMDVVYDPWLITTPMNSRLRSFYLSSGNLVAAETVDTETGPEDARRTSVAAAHATAGPSTHFLGVFDRKPAAGGRSVLGALYDTWIGGPTFDVCFGDNSGTACPCFNNGASHHGCANSADAAGGLLRASGAALVGSDSLVLTTSSVPNGGCLLFQGTGFTWYGTVFGDGLLCVTGTILRLGVNIAAGGTTSFPSGSTPISQLGGLPLTGGDRSYQVWYRDAASYCTSAVFNLTNAVVVRWL